MGHCKLLGCHSTEQKTPQGCRVLQAPLLCLGSQIERKFRVWSRPTEQLSVQAAATAQSVLLLTTRPGRAPRSDACTAKAELIQPEGENAKISPGTFMRDPTCWNGHETYSQRVQSQNVAAPPPHANILFGHPTLKQGTRPSLSMHAVAPDKLCYVVSHSRHVADTAILAFV